MVPLDNGDQRRSQRFAFCIAILLIVMTSTLSTMHMIDTEEFTALLGAISTITIALLKPQFRK